MGSSTSNREGERSESRADLDDAIFRCDPGETNDLLADVRIMDEVLSKRLTWNHSQLLCDLPDLGRTKECDLLTFTHFFTHCGSSGACEGAEAAFGILR